jgi:hypothetical protein
VRIVGERVPVVIGRLADEYRNVVGLKDTVIEFLEYYAA